MTTFVYPPPRVRVESGWCCRFMSAAHDSYPFGIGVACMKYSGPELCLDCAREDGENVDETLTPASDQT